MPEPAWLGGPLAELAEGPRWWDGQLIWVDILGGRVHHWEPSTGRVSTDAYDDTVSVAHPRATGGEVLGLGASVCLRDPDGSLRPLAVLGPEHMRCNEGLCSPEGALYIGTMRRDGDGREGRLVRIAPDGQVDVVLTGLAISNGLGFDLARDRVYYIDSRDGRVDLLDVRSGTREPFVHIDERLGLPDGLTLDSDGGVWVAVYGGSRVQRFSPDGELTDEVVVPVTNVTSCTFGDKELFITTAQEHLTEQERAEQPLAGGVFRVATDRVGVPITPFGG